MITRDIVVSCNQCSDSFIVTNNPARSLKAINAILPKGWVYIASVACMVRKPHPITGMLEDAEGVMDIHHCPDCHRENTPEPAPTVPDK